MKTMKRRELFWMIVPCLLLAGAGIYFARRDAPRAPEKFGVLLDEVKLVPATPRDVARGYDTVVLAKARMVGPATMDFSDSKTRNHQIWFETAVVDSKGRAVQPVDNAGFATHDIKPRYYAQQTSFPLKLSKVPSAAGPVFFQVQARGEIWNASVTKPLNEAVSPTKKLQVRRAGETVKPPKVSKYRPFKVLGFQIIPEAGTANCSLVIFAELFEPLQRVEGRGQISIDNARIIADVKTIAANSGHGYTPGNNPIDITKNLTLPAQCRHAVFKGDLSINDCWPLPIEVELRKDGKAIIRPKPAM